MKPLKTKNFILTPLETEGLNPENFIWSYVWSISFIETGRDIGTVSFKSPPENGTVELVMEAVSFEEEALKAVINWAFTQKGVYFVETISPYFSSEFLSMGFYAVSADKYELEKPPSSFTSIYMSLFLGVGLCFGTAFKNTALGLCFGVAIGLCLGSAMDADDKKKRMELKEAKRHNIHNENNEP